MINTNSIMIRLEKKEEYREVKKMVRESFWNVYRPGCFEHYVLNQLRDDPAFVPELDFVMEQDGQLIGQNMFMRANIKADDGRTISIMTMGPICITPEPKRKGYGKILLDYSLEKAKELGCGAVCSGKHLRNSLSWFVGRRRCILLFMQRIDSGIFRWDYRRVCNTTGLFCG